MKKVFNYYILALCKVFDIGVSVLMFPLSISTSHYLSPEHIMPIEPFVNHWEHSDFWILPTM